MTNRSEVLDVAVVGAGLTGSLIAGAQSLAGGSVLVLDKARGAGGRLSIRRTPQGAFAHGCSTAVVAACVSASPRLAEILRDSGRAASERAPETPLPKRLLGAAQARFGVQVASIERADGRWRLRAAGGELLAEAARMVLTAPAPQSAALLESVRPDWAQTLRALRMRPAWSLLLALPAGRTAPNWSGAQELLGAVEEQAPNPVDAATNAYRRWVLRLSDAASVAMLEDSPEQVLAAVCERLGLAAGELSHAAAHRWRYARAIDFLPERLLHDRVQHLAVCGDVFAADASGGDLGRCVSSAEALLEAWGLR
jgi:renalase